MMISPYRRCHLLILIILLGLVSRSLAQPPSHGGCAAEKCGTFDSIPFPFYLNASCESLSDAFRLSCSNSTSLFLNIGSQSYKVLHFFPDGGGLLVDFPNTTSTSSGSSSCQRYYDLRSFGFERNGYFSVSTDNVLGLYSCDDSSLCRADCENITLKMPAGCDNSSNSTPSAPACCYPLSSDSSVWRVGDGFSVFSQFGCRGFSCWVGSNSINAAAPKRGVKLEWAVPNNLIKGVCDFNAHIVNATSVMSGMRCRCLDGFVGDGFAHGVGCLKSCLKDGEETYGRDCHMKGHGRRKLVLVAGVLTSGFSMAALTALFFLLKRPTKSGTFDRDLAHSQSSISFRKACRTRLFSYHELEEATKGFEDDQKLVDGNGSKLYAGVLGDGTQVAVQKVQCASERDLIQVLSRVEVLSGVSHRNMARLLGCSIDSGYTPLVVYEYPANGNLDEHLRQCREQKLGLDWHKRLNIAAQTASILAFLQCEIFPPVVHHGLQSGCILLDEDFSVKVAGFELFCGDGASYHLFNKDNHGCSQFNSRNDVYSLGVVLLEIIAGGRCVDLPTVALRKIRSGKLEEIVDPLLYYHEQPGFRREQIEMVADLATRCLLFGVDGKLGMNDVARELVHITKESIDGGSRRGPALEETFSNSSLLQMISMSPDSIYVP